MPFYSHFCPSCKDCCCCCSAFNLSFPCWSMWQFFAQAFHIKLPFNIFSWQMCSTAFLPMSFAMLCEGDVVQECFLMENVVQCFLMVGMIQCLLMDRAFQWFILEKNVSMLILLDHVHITLAFAQSCNEGDKNSEENWGTFQSILSLDKNG